MKKAYLHALATVTSDSSKHCDNFQLVSLKPPARPQAEFSLNTKPRATPKTIRIKCPTTTVLSGAFNKPPFF